MGTLAYMAPEVINCCHDKRCGYDKRCDLWSIGVIAYRLLSGQFPFFETDSKDMDENIFSFDYDFAGAEWTHISQDAKEFIKALIVVDPGQRMNCEEALAHPWLYHN